MGLKQRIFATTFMVVAYVLTALLFGDCK